MFVMPKERVKPIFFTVEPGPESDNVCRENREEAGESNDLTEHCEAKSGDLDACSRHPVIGRLAENMGDRDEHRRIPRSRVMGR